MKVVSSSDTNQKNAKQLWRERGREKRERIWSWGGFWLNYSSNTCCNKDFMQHLLCAFKHFTYIYSLGNKVRHFSRCLRVHIFITILLKSLKSTIMAGWTTMQSTTQATLLYHEYKKIIQGRTCFETKLNNLRRSIINKFK